MINSLDWDWVARSRNTVHYNEGNCGLWNSVRSLYCKATRIPKFVCTGLLSKGNPIKCNFYIYKGKKKNRIARNKLGNRKRTSKSKKHAKANREPWVLVTSIKGGNKEAKRIIAIYTKRMQIEEGFRDLKSSRYGFCFEQSKTYKPLRMEILLLIAMLAALAAFIIGIAAKERDLQYSFQANTVRNKNVLSIFFLGCQIIKNRRIKFTREELYLAILVLQAIVLKGWRT